MKRLGKFALITFVRIGGIGYSIISIIWCIACTLVCGLAALLATPMALVTKSNKCLLAILGVWVIALALPGKLIGIEKVDWNDYSPKIANYMREKGFDPVIYADDNINESKELIKDYWNDEES
jgi:hypothetical protein